MTTSGWRFAIDIIRVLLALALTMGGLWYALIEGDYARGAFYLLMVTMGYASDAAANTERRPRR